MDPDAVQRPGAEPGGEPGGERRAASLVGPARVRKDGARRGLPARRVESASPHRPGAVGGLRAAVAVLGVVTVALLVGPAAGCGGSGGSGDGAGAEGPSTPGPAPGPGPPPPSGPVPVGLLAPDDVVHLGAFALPEGRDRPHTFEYGGNAMTFRPDGDPAGAGDGYPGSLFVTGHDRLAYGELPDGSRVAEVSIPAPVRVDDPAVLPRAVLLQDLAEVTRGLFDGLDEIPRIGLEYLDHPVTGPLVHLAWGAHFQDAPRPSHGLVSPDLSSPDPRGAWFVGDASPYSVNGYLFQIPGPWADANAGGRVLATGRYRDGGWSGKGPALFAYVPWVDGAGTLAAPGSRLGATTLLLYGDSRDDPDPRRDSIPGYQEADEWEGGAWITTTTGREAVLFAGTKGVGEKYWYGWKHPAGAERPCVETDLVDQFVTCRTAAGDPCPAADLTGCEGHDDDRGWWSSRFQAQLLLYDPSDLAAVAAGRLDPAEPLPYARIDLDPHLFLPAQVAEPENLGTGVQRRFRIGPVAYDRANDRLYVLELFAERARPVVHVFSVGVSG